ncbi:Vitellogenin-like 11, partial [Homarus americanus]
MVKREVDALMQQYPVEYEAIKEVMAKVGGVLLSDLDTLRHDPVTLLTAILIFGNVDELMQKVKLNAITMLYDILWAYDSHTTLPFNNVMWIIYTLQPPRVTDLLPPHTRTAMVVGDTEILTFDNAKLRAPISPCKVVLAAYASNKLTMAHPQPSAPPQITLSTRTTTVTIKPDFRVDVNGREIGTSDVTIGELTIEQSNLQVKLISPFMIVRVATKERVVSLEVSGWTFGRLAGLLGTYDGESGNDWTMPTGIQASTLQELVTSWQEDQQCHAPDVSLVSPAQVTTERLFHCYPLLGVWSRCNSLVRPEPFIHLCYTTTDPCYAAQAYRTMCTTKGIGPLVPRGC